MGGLPFILSTVSIKKVSKTSLLAYKQFTRSEIEAVILKVEEYSKQNLRIIVVYFTELWESGNHREKATGTHEEELVNMSKRKGGRQYVACVSWSVYIWWWYYCWFCPVNLLYRSESILLNQDRQVIEIPCFEICLNSATREICSFQK